MASTIYSYEKGYKKGYEAGSSGEPSPHPGHFFDLMNTKDVQEYEDGVEEGYKDGLEHYNKNR